MNSLEDLMIYKQYLEMIYYTENITIKYPKNEKNKRSEPVNGADLPREKENRRETLRNFHT